MKTDKRFFSLQCGFLLFLLIFSACEYEGPVSVWEIVEGKTQIIPEITRVLPEDAGTANTLIIEGYHFSSEPEENWVYFDQTRCAIISSSETSIEIYRPNISGDSITVSVSVLNAAAVARFGPYCLEAVVEEFGQFTESGHLLAMTVDADERMYLVMGSAKVIRLNANGVRDETFTGTTPFTDWTDMEMGPDSSIYMVRSDNQIFRMGPEGGEPELYIQLESSMDLMKTIDFDESGRLFGGGRKSGLICVRPYSPSENLGYYNDYDIISVCVYNGYVYVAARYIGQDNRVAILGVYRHEIRDGIIPAGERETVLNWDEGPLGAAIMLDMAFSEDGILYIGSSDAESPLVMVDPVTGNYTTLFRGIIPSPVSRIVWGNGKSIYALVGRDLFSDEDATLLKINAGESGAP